MPKLYPLSKSALRDLIRPDGRDWICVGSKLPAIKREEPTREEGPLAWYVIMTNPRCEKRAQSGLVDKGFAVYFPQYREERIFGRKRVRAIMNRSLFPRYLFVQARYGSWPRITATDGVQALVRDGGSEGKPMAVSDSAIAFLLDQQNAGEFDVLFGGDRQPKGKAKKMRAPFLLGEQVQIISGPLEGFYATVQAAIAGHSADILIEIFGRPTRLDIDIAQIKKA
jgi:transcription antitermination factor NusG